MQRRPGRRRQWMGGIRSQPEIAAYVGVPLGAVGYLVGKRMLQGEAWPHTPV
jgi:hypothetical protein